MWVLLADVFRDVHKKISVLQSLFNKVAGLNTCNFIQKRLPHVNIAKYLRTAFFIEHIQWLLYS